MCADVTTGKRIDSRLKSPAAARPSVSRLPDGRNPWVEDRKTPVFHSFQQEVAPIRLQHCRKRYRQGVVSACTRLSAFPIMCREPSCTDIREMICFGSCG